MPIAWAVAHRLSVKGVDGSPLVATGYRGVQGARVHSPDHLAVRSWAAAWVASSVRVVMPSLAKMWDRCTLTVPGAMNRRRAMASFRRPSLTRRATSRSAGVRLAQPVAGRLRPPPLRGGIGHGVVEGECLALVPCLGEAVVADGMPRLTDGAVGGAAVGGESGGQVLQRLPGRVGGGQ